MDTARPLRHCLALLAALVLSSATASCAGGTPDAASDAPDPSGSWHLASGRDAEGAFPGLSAREVTLVWDAEGVSGTSACNLYGATAAVDGATVRFSNASGTEMACAPDVMGLERRYLAALTASERLQRAGDRLTLSGPDVALEFELDAPVQDAELVGTAWVLESLVDGEVVSSAVPGGELRFRRDGTLEGSSGCRPVQGTYEVRGGKVTIEDLEGDAHAGGGCEADGEAQHRHVVDVLQGGFSAEVDGNRLVLASADGRGLDFRAG